MPRSEKQKHLNKIKREGNDSVFVHLVFQDDFHKALDQKDIDRESLELATRTAAVIEILDRQRRKGCLFCAKFIEFSDIAAIGWITGKETGRAAAMAFCVCDTCADAAVSRNEVFQRCVDKWQNPKSPGETHAPGHA